MGWVAKLRGPEGTVSVLGVHGSYSAARWQADEFNRRYQFDRAFVEESDPADVFSQRAERPEPPSA